MVRNFLVVVLATLFCVTSPALAENKPAKFLWGSAAATASLATAASPQTKLFPNPHSTTAYLHIRTGTEVATASLVITVFDVNAVGLGQTGTLLCTVSALTTSDTQVTILLGASQTASEGVTQVCKPPLGAFLKFVATTSGAGADLPATIEFESLSSGF